MCVISSSQAQRRMETETGGKAEDAGQSWGEGKTDK